MTIDLKSVTHDRWHLAVPSDWKYAYPEEPEVALLAMPKYATEERFTPNVVLTPIVYPQVPPRLEYLTATVDMLESTLGDILPIAATIDGHDEETYTANVVIGYRVGTFNVTAWQRHLVHGNTALIATFTCANSEVPELAETAIAVLESAGVR